MHDWAFFGVALTEQYEDWSICSKTCEHCKVLMFPSDYKRCEEIHLRIGSGLLSNSLTLTVDVRSRLPQLSA
jgi:hypothetical protein